MGKGLEQAAELQAPSHRIPPTCGSVAMKPEAGRKGFYHLPKVVFNSLVVWRSTLLGGIIWVGGGKCEGAVSKLS